MPRLDSVRLTAGGVNGPPTTPLTTVSPTGATASEPPPAPPSWLRAWSRRIRGLVIPLRLSVTPRPVLLKALRISSTVAFGDRERITANAPATCGVAIEVPLSDAKPPPGTAELMLEPGASRSRICALLEKLDTVSDLVVEPTLIAVEMQAGAPMAEVRLSLPDAITVAIPAERRRSIAAFAGWSSQADAYWPPPRLMLTAAMLKLLRWL